MKNYLTLLRDVLANGTCKPTRAKLSDGNHVEALSVFGRSLRFNLADGFPLVTTKRVSWKTALVELTWMLSGDTNIRYLNDKGVHIWDAWADANGDLGPVYGAQLRRWQAFDGEIDQVAQLLNDIRAVVADPTASPGRRLILSMWNVGELSKMALPPCPMVCQFNVTDGKLSCLVYQRSADLFIGLPYDIAVYAMLTHMIAQLSKLDVGELIFSIGDAHIYANHIEQVKEQLTRDPRPLPSATCEVGVTWEADRKVAKIKIHKLRVNDYDPCGEIRGEVAV